MAIIFEQLGLLFLFMSLGFIFGKCKLISHEHTKILSVLEIYLFVPCTVFNAFYSNFTKSNLTRYYMLILVAIAVLLAAVCFAYPVSKALGKGTYKQKVFNYSLVIPNYGYMGYALAQGIFGAEGLLYMVLFALPFSVYTYTFGFCMLTNRKLSFKRLLNPIILSIFIGAIFGFFSIGLPSVLETVINKSASCMAPISMLLAGIVLSEFNVKQLLSDVKVYVVTFLRLFLIPCIVMLVLKCFCDEITVRTAVLFCAMPCGLNTIVFPKLIGEDCAMGAKLAFISNILCILTIPMILYFI